MSGLSDTVPSSVWEIVSSTHTLLGNSLTFGEGIACDALKDILIHLQGTLLRNLWAAQNDDNHTDFNILVDASDMGRIRSVTVLNELYMRMAQAAPVRRELPAPGRVQTLDSITGSESPWDFAQHPPLQSQELPLAQSPLQTPNAQRLPAQNPFPSRDHTQDPNPSKSPKPARMGWLHTLKSRKDIVPPDSDTSGFSTLVSELNVNDSPLGIQFDGKAPSTWNPPSQDFPALPNISKTRSECVLPPSPWQPSPDLSIPEDNPWEEEVSSSQSVAGAFTPDLKQQGPRRRSTEATLVDRDSNYGHDLTPYTTEARSRPEAAPLTEEGRANHESRPSKMKLHSWSWRRSSAEATQLKENKSPPQTPGQKPRVSPIVSQTRSSQSSSSPKPNPDAKNLYSGFCVGAYKMQVGFGQESLKLKNASISMGGEMNYWACINKYCVFEGPAWKSGKNWTISNAVRVRHGVQYRWQFLAKSHVALSKTSGRAFDYQCIFCISQAQPSAVYRTEPAFIEHISTHRGQRAEASIADKFCCIDDRVARAEEDFDINLTPHGTAQNADGSLRGHSWLASPEMTELDTHSTEGGFPWAPAGRFLGANV